MLLGQTIEDASSPSNGSPVVSPNKGCLLDDGEELQLDFSQWRREITANEQARQMRNPLRTHVKVQKITPAGSPLMRKVDEESKFVANPH